MSTQRLLAGATINSWMPSVWSEGEFKQHLLPLDALVMVHMWLGFANTVQPPVALIVSQTMLLALPYRESGEWAHLRLVPTKQVGIDGARQFTTECLTLQMPAVLECRCTAQTLSTALGMDVPRDAGSDAAWFLVGRYGDLHKLAGASLRYSLLLAFLEGAAMGGCVDVVDLALRSIIREDLRTQLLETDKLLRCALRSGNPTMMKHFQTIGVFGTVEHPRIAMHHVMLGMVPVGSFGSMDGRLACCRFLIKERLVDRAELLDGLDSALMKRFGYSRTILE